MASDLPASFKHFSTEKFNTNDGKKVVHNPKKDCNCQHLWGQIDDGGHDVSVSAFQSQESIVCMCEKM